MRLKMDNPPCFIDTNGAKRRMTSPTNNRPSLPAWQALQAHHEQNKETRTADLFAANPQRFTEFSERFEGLLLDYSKNRLTDETRKLLVQLANETNLSEWIGKMFSGEKINHTEKRAVLHTALRTPKNATAVEVDGKNVLPDVHTVLDQIETFCNKLHSGEWKGFTGKTITDVVNIGIGGSDLGPHMVVHALSAYQKEGIRAHFDSNLDGRQINDILNAVDPETTLFIIASKTFTTLETMTNANSARNWFLEQIKSRGGDESTIAKHFVAASTNLEATGKFGIDSNNVFAFWDWVGGRYSLWSAVGLSIAAAIGMDNFRDLLAGAHAMDEHFRTADFDKNLPVLMALIGVWNRNFLNAESSAVLPYDVALELFPSFLQQMDMESNGKFVDRDGKTVNYDTSPLIWGEPGSNGQHSFFQFLHQSPTLVAIDFIGTLEPAHNLPAHHDRLMANMLAQAEALMNGKDEATARAGLSNLSKEDQDLLTPYKIFPGNTPSSILMLDRLDPRTLGALVALYEHKVFTQGVIWNMNSFDQMGVELGKELAKSIQDDLEAGKVTQPHDASTTGLMELYLQHRQKSE